MLGLYWRVYVRVSLVFVIGVRNFGKWVLVFWLFFFLGFCIIFVFLIRFFGGLYGDFWSYSFLGFKFVVDFGVLYTVFFGVDFVVNIVFKFN